MTEQLPIDLKPFEALVEHGEKPTEDAINLFVQSAPSYTAEEERRVRLKMDIWVLPVLCIMNLVAYLDKANIGNAKVAGLTKDLGLTGGQYAFLLTIFYIIYTACQWEMIMLKFIPPKIWLTSIVLLWGLAACLQGICNSYHGLLACRAVIALLEAGGGPAIAFYFSLLYPRGEFGLRWGIFQATAALANSFAGAIAYGVLDQPNNTRFADWQLVFIVESIPTFVSGILLFIFLPSAPNKCIFLNKRENEIALERLQRAQSALEPNRYSRPQLLGAFKEPWMYWTALMHFFSGLAFNSLSVFLTEIVNDMGFTALKAQGLVAPPWLVAWILTILFGYISDRWSIRGYIIAGGHLLGAVGYLVIAFAKPIGARYFAVYITCCGVYFAEPILFSWCSTNASTDSKRAVALTLFLTTGQCGSILGANVYGTSGRHILGNSLCAGGLIINVGLALGGVSFLKWRNRVKDAEYGRDQQANTSTPSDGKDPRAFRFVI